MLIRHGLFAAPLLALLLSLPAAADVRPKARPLAVTDATAAGPAPRPRHNPAYAALLPVAAPAAALRQSVPHLPLDLIAGLVAQAGVSGADSPSGAVGLPDPVGLPLQGTLPVDPPLLAAARRASLYQVVISAASAAAAQVAMPGLRPRARPAPGASAPVAAATALFVRPLPRPALPPQPAPSVAGAAVQLAVAVAVPALRPQPRPQNLARRAVPPSGDATGGAVPVALVVRPEPGKPLVRSKKGSVCGDPSIRGETIPPIPARMKGCGLAEPVRVTEIDGIRLSTPATIDCGTARAMKTWINAGLRPAFGRKDPPVALTVAASYACRARNNIPGNKISEHGRGRAVDISGIVLKSGATNDVRRDWRGSKALRAAHRAGCGPFGTTLGPGSDGYHEDNLHYDTANLNRPYCR